MDELLFARSTGALGPNAFARIQKTRLLKSFAPASKYRFDGGERRVGVNDDEASSSSDTARSIWAHQAGVNALAIERFRGRLMVSGGADASIKVWNLHNCGTPSEPHTFEPVSTIRPRGDNHKFGITQLSFYPFDSGAFISSSYDQTVKVWSTEDPKVAGSFNLGYKVYTHAMSPIGHHLLIACGTQHPAVRLADIRSGASTHCLAGHAGAVLAAAWSPKHEHTLATGSVDGTVRIWDVRRASPQISMLDQDDLLGIYHNGLMGKNGDIRSRACSKAHDAPVNGLSWTDDGAYIISAGHDNRIRVWDAATGRNTLASFGPTIKNRQLASMPILTSPVGIAHPGKELLFWPNENEILVCDLHDGHVITRLRAPGTTASGARTTATPMGRSVVRNRITGLAWRGGGGGGGSNGMEMGGSTMAGAIFSAHLDGQIRAWTPQLEGVNEDEDLDSAEEDERKKNKRKAMNDIYNSLMGKKITFT